ncbi:Acyltransferase family protein [Dyadobacter koreensis]|uniref:Acyltransferase family protein n=1 Tax=Dyadobacter koreensis TaxID=408657 RepID=A0A1H6QPI8_9BACT|nr:acyltransferase [Dyadobacter koreensis]SEI41360.1 Acyltransferase family protein [Dyadobacter koreensis]
MSASFTQSASTDPPLRGKLLYIDHLKVLLTALVIIHHALVTYGAPGGWYYFEKTEITGAVIAMTMAVSIDQSFFMGFFFFLSALFIPGSLKRKGSAVFVRDRFFRLGIPLIYYSLLQATIMNFLVYRYAENHDITFKQFLLGYDGWIDVGVLWFVLALLLFTLCYIIYTKIAKPDFKDWSLPSIKQILFFAAVLGLITFLIRTVFAVGWVLEPLGFQLGHFPQYIAMFIFGLIAAENHWISRIDQQHYRKLHIFVFCMIFIGFPFIFSLKIIFGQPLEWFVGGWHIAALLYALWEQIIGVSLMAALLTFGKKRLNKSSNFMNKMSRCAFAVYILHPLVLVALSLLLKDWAVDPSIKFLIVAPLGVTASFLLGFAVVKIPGVNQLV